MTGRQGQLAREERLEIGRAVRKALADNACWKTLEGRFGRERTSLWRYAREAQFQDATKNLEVATSRPLRLGRLVLEGRGHDCSNSRVEHDPS